MTTLSYGVPVAGSDLNSTADPMISSALTTILNWAGGNIDGTNVAATLTGRRPIHYYNVVLSSGTMSSGGTFVMPAFQASGNGSSGGAAWLHLDPTNFAVTGKSNTQMIIRIAFAANATPTGVTFTFALNAATLGSVANGVTITAGAAQTGSTITFTTPGASSESVVETSPFTFPSGLYVPTLNLSGAAAVNSGVIASWQLFAVNS